MIRLTRGDSVDWKFQRKFCDGSVIQTQPQDITFTMRKQPNSTVVIQKKLSNGGIVFQVADKTYHIKMSSEETQDFEPIEYGYDIQVEDENYTKTIGLGKIKVIADYTYPEVSA